MVQILGAMVGVALLLAIGEHLHNLGKIRGEYARKFIHISVGLFVATWPLFMEWYFITLVAIAMTLVVAAAKYFRLLKTIYSVNRNTSGELMFSLGVGLTAALFHDGYVFSAAILTLALADGLAAVIGTRYGKSTAYKLLGNKKSLAGTITFFVIASLINGLYWAFFGDSVAIAVLPAAFLYGASIAAGCIEAGVEAALPHGLDNIGVPVIAACLLTLMH